nr:DUF2922 domain-containing protein [Heyndrickxia shackletonii]
MSRYNIYLTKPFEKKREVKIVKTLELQFVTANNKTASVSIEDPIEPVDTAKVKAAMEQLIAANVFQNSTGYAFTEMKGARLVDHNVTEYTIE